jgi:hypothetical protein
MQSHSEAQALKIVGMAVHMMDQLLSVYEEMVVEAIPSHFHETEACDVTCSLHILPLSEQFPQCLHAEEVNTF